MIAGGRPGPLVSASAPEWSESFEQWYAASVDDALRLAYSLTRNRQQAEDAVADVFVRIYGRRQLAGIQQPRAYIRRAVTNAVVSEFRRRGRERAVLGRTQAAANSADAGEGICERDALSVLLAKLPPRQRTAVTLRYLADLSEAEVARRMGTSVGAVKSNTARGIVALRAAAARADLERVVALREAPARVA